MDIEALTSLFALRAIPNIFLREHDLILLAEPFALLEQVWTIAHTERLYQAIERHFVRSAAMFHDRNLSLALQASCTEALTYRRTGQPNPETGASTSVLLTCAPKAHLAFANFLERGACFTVEIIGRVASRHKP